jgi:hypothetical protein
MQLALIRLAIRYNKALALKRNYIVVMEEFPKLYDRLTIRSSE